MKKNIVALLLLSVLFFAFHNRESEPATKFLDSLSPEQLNKAQLVFDDKAKHDWHYLPATMYPRAGILLNELYSEQKQLLFDLLQTSLSETGYSKTKQIISLENVLAEISGDKIRRDPEKYYAAFYGNPENDSLWAWSFQGHHISLNFTILNGKTSIAPRFLGANPARITSGKRKGERTLSKEDDLGLELINSLSKEQKEKAIFQQKKSFRGIVSTNSAEVTPLKPVGIKMKELNQVQQNTLLKLIKEYLANMPNDLASTRMNKLKKEELDEIQFGWAGATELGKPHYYRIQGKSFLVEFDKTQNNANHIHSVWRDFAGDFGRDLIREHYQSSNHHH